MNTSVGGPSMIPEPDSYAMLLAGLGLIGMIVRRRRAVSVA
ncbi:MAG: PEPxxWA-CTERM sorting domain-containing protein [Nitrosospira multiformis]|nr:PEPxxWA-CTERM sorting domain-containing protein [Nitrosospira multiformis]